jgi:outer membrane protein assembly factor BamB
MSDVEFEPVVVIMGSAIVALRPRDGTIAWHVPTDQPVVRMYRVHTRMFAVSGTRVICIDLRTGEVIGQVDVGFAPESGMVCDGQLVLLRGGQAGAAPEALVCLTSDGRLRWHGTLTVEGKNAQLATLDAGGRTKSKITFPFTDAPAGIAYRDGVVQPDLNR